MINIDKLAYKEVNFKSKLLEWSQKNRVKVNFELLKQKVDGNGSPIFDYQVVLEGVKGCNAQGYSKKESQQMASKLTLQRLRREPQFIDEVFAAKTHRTKMEEEPVLTVPDTETKTDFIIEGAMTEEPAANRKKAKRDLPDGLSEVIEHNKPEERENIKTDKPEDKAKETDEFDLSHITARAMSREEIIAAAESQAFGEQ